MPQAPDLVFPKLEDTPHAISSTGLIVVVASVLLIVLSIFTTMIAATKNSKKLTLQRTKDDLTNQLNSPELATIKRQLDGFVQTGGAITQALNSRIDWRSFFSSFNSVIPTSVHLVNLNLDEQGNLRIDGDSPDYVSIAKLVNTMEASPTFRSVTVNTITPSGTTNRFSISAGANLSKFALKATPAPAATGTSATQGGQSQ